MILRCLLLLPFLFFTLSSHAQKPSAPEADSILKDAPKVFIDCRFCDEEYTKQQMTYLNYVRDRMASEVHVMASQQTTGSGGKRKMFEFIGRGKFEGMVDTLYVTTGTNDTDTEVRDAELRTIQMGLFRYIAQTPIAQHFEFTFTKPVAATEVTDRWNNWVFDMGVSGWANGQSSQSSLNMWGEVSAERITEDVRISIGGWANRNSQSFDVEGEKIVSLIQNQSVDGEYVKSINGHWSWGVFGYAGGSIYNNIAFEYRLHPGIEYNLFPYSESSKRQLRIGYFAGAGSKKYIETTVFGKNQEYLYSHNLNIAYRVQQPWGSVNAGIELNQFFHDLELNSISTRLNCNLRLFKGFSVRIGGNFSLINDQIQLPATNLTAAQILLSQKAQATNFRYWANFGVNYTFGSIFNSIVNPRFGG